MGSTCDNTSANFVFDSTTTFNDIACDNDGQNLRCIDPGRVFNGVLVAEADPGFVCNFFDGPACTGNFLGLLDSSTTGNCQNRKPRSALGRSAKCFSNKPVDPSTCTTSTPPSVAVSAAATAAAAPASSFNASVSVGKTLISVDIPGESLVHRGVAASCNGLICDPTTPFNEGFSHFGKSCALLVKMDGTFENTDQRDYMANLMAKAVGITDANSRGDCAESTETIFDTCPTVLDSISFAEVVLRQGDNIVGQMTYTVEVACQKPCNADCSKLTEDITGAVLSAVPGVGSVLSEIFKVVICGDTGNL